MTNPEQPNGRARAGRIVLLAILVPAGLALLYNSNTASAPVSAAATSAPQTDPAADAQVAAPTGESDNARSELNMPDLKAGDSILSDLYGNGDTVTRPIRISGPWELQWAFSTSGAVSVETDKGHAVDSHYVPETAPVGTAYQAQTGMFTVKVDCGGSWHVRLVRVGGKSTD